jgi:hypothetical protein
VTSETARPSTVQPGEDGEVLGRRQRSGALVQRAGDRVDHRLDRQPAQHFPESTGATGRAAEGAGQQHQRVERQRQHRLRALRGRDDGGRRGA